jgi:serine protease Do
MNENLNPETQPKSSSLNLKTVATIVFLSLVFGAAGGAFGTAYLVRLPGLQKYLPKASGPGMVSQKIVLNEDSAVIDVVKKASPAVVSIVISKDLSKVPGFGVNPFNFNFDQLSPFFEIPQTQPNKGQSGNDQPNIQQVGAGSGFFVSSDGLILTNRHVVSDEQASYTVVTQEGKIYDAKVLARDPRNDLAIIKIDIKDAPFLNLADSSKIQIGQRVIAIGNSLGQYQNTVTTGVVSGIGRSITAGSNDGSEQLEGVIQTDAAINPGNSGGPLLNATAQVIGINTAIDQQGQLVSFAIPSNDAAKALESYKKSGKIVRPFLGVRYIIISKALAQQENLPQDHGALVVRGNSVTDFAVIPGSPADKAGLTENDIILSVDGQTIDENHTLAGLIKDKNVGDAVTLKVYHRGQEKEVKITLEESK